MKSKSSFLAMLALGVGLFGTAATAQNAQVNNTSGARVEYGTFDPGQSGLLRQADWDDHRRCDGDHDRDDRGCYYRDRDGRYRYRSYSYYGNSYVYVTPYYNYAPNAGWYDRDGRWHAYDRDRDRDRRRHDGDDRR